MSAPLRTICHFRPAFCLAAFATVLSAALVALPAHGQGTHLWTQSKLEEFEKGTSQGVAIESDGRLREGPGLKEIYTTPSTFVWSVAAGKSGVAFIGTGSPGAVYRIAHASESKPFALFSTRDLSVQVVRVGPDGYVYAATLPSGKVYRLKADAEAKQDDTTATVVFDMSKLGNADASENKESSAKADAKAHYIWDMTFDAAGKLYIATGDPGAVYRVDPAHTSAAPVQFFKGDEAHIRSLAWDAKGNLIAGTDGSGLIYRISPDGKGYVMFEAPRREITSVVVAADGTIYAANVGDKSHNPLPPLPVQGIGTATITIVQPSSVQTVNSSASLPDGTEIYAITDGQAPRKVWSGKDEVVYALAAHSDDLFALTGNRGHILRIKKDGSFADIGHLDAQQGLSFAEAYGGAQGFDGVLIGTGNTGKLCLLGAAEKHEYASDVLDTDAMARFGRVEIEPGSSGYEILTRSGNVAQPVRGWTDWQPLNNGQVASPAGRFLQWKAVLHAGGNIGGVGVNYLPVNAAPVVDEIVVVTGARLNPQILAASQSSTVNISFPTPGAADATVTDTSSASPISANKDKGGVTVRWAAHDENGDDLTYSLFLRGDGESVWRLLKDKITEKAYSFDAALIPDGGYQIKIVASDSPSHTPADALSGQKVSDRFEVDTTPPTVVNLKAVAETGTCQGDRCPKVFRLSFDAQDAYSPIAHAEYSLDAGPWQYVEPVKKISDSKIENYSLQLSFDAPDGKLGEHLITVRAYDRFENVGAAKMVIPAQDK